MYEVITSLDHSWETVYQHRSLILSQKRFRIFQVVSPLITVLLGGLFVSLVLVQLTRSHGMAFTREEITRPTSMVIANECTIAFTSGSAVTSLSDVEQIFTVGDDGNNLRKLSDSPGYKPVWSPDGTRIAFIGGNRTHDLFVVDVDGGNARSLAQNLSTLDAPTWSQDGNWIAFISAEPDLRSKLYVVDTAGRNLQHFGDQSGFYSSPAWSSDGSQIAFTLELEGSSVQNSDTRLAGLQQHSLEFAFREPAIYLINADGSNFRLLAQEGLQPQWSPDGTQIAFISKRDEQIDVYVIGAKGEDEYNITNHDSDDYNPRWSPDGTQLVFVSERDGNGEIYLIDADGRNLRRLTNQDVDDSYPTWSPDGNRIAFASDGGFWKQLWIMDADGSNLRNLEYALLGQPVWSPVCN